MFNAKVLLIFSRSIILVDTRLINLVKNIGAIYVLLQCFNYSKVISNIIDEILACDDVIRKIS